MNNKFLISIDSGKAYTKGVIRNEEGIIKKILFPTKVADVFVKLKLSHNRN